MISVSSNNIMLLLLGVAAVYAHNAKRCPGTNETYYEYRSCLLTCDDLNNSSCDGEISYDPGCYCSEGFLRKNGICIPRDECNALSGRHMNCPKNEVFLKYRLCRESCDNPHNKNCDGEKFHSPGCYCAPGYRRKNGLCIPKKECLNAKGTNKECGENETYSKNKPCVINCGDLISYKDCQERQNAPGCYCKPGYLKKGGRCVPKEECPEFKEKKSESCGLNEDYLKYVPCLQTCADLERGTCGEEARRYAPGCYCAEGYVRRNGVCIPEDACLSVEPIHWRSEQCALNEEYLEYEPCLQNCDDLSSTKCDRILKKNAPGCYCREGYLRKGGICIPKSQCKIHFEKHTKTCGINEVFQAYKPFSENCEDRGGREDKTEKQFAPGCYCYPGYLRKDGTCIPKERCSKGNECGLNEEYTEYEPCHQTCDDLESKKCDLKSRRYSPGCYCKEGYLRQNGLCLPKEDCHYEARDKLKECPTNERFLEYKPCREYCDDPERCDDGDQYAPGCYCAKGYLRKDGECVPDYQCDDSSESDS
ncbi:unnamed protein product [Callosobruchus maculatus]|uniref:TIL domain-containing protein n=1 Tax=Callosobruchus maculatus TaxID=64391 RepID=A0A653BFW5_CALMS|nr:unnamed protein product [Callosobruchus maculatus]